MPIKDTSIKPTPAPVVNAYGLTAEQAQRLAAVEEARTWRPYYLVFNFTSGPVPQNSVIPLSSDNLDLPVEVVGAITDLPGFDIQVRPSAGRPWAQKPIPIEALAGVYPGSTGVNYPYYFEEAVPLEQGAAVALDMKAPTAGLDLNGYVVLICRAYDPKALADAERQRYINFIKANPRQRNVWLRMDVDYTVSPDSKTDKYDQPLLIIGATTKLKGSTIEVTDARSAKWGKLPVPIWAIAGQYQKQKEQYIEFSRPVFLSENMQLSATFANNIALEPADPNTGSVILKAKTI